MRFSSRVRAIFLALFVTILWSTSWVFIKRALNEVPPLTFAGLRYSMAFLILLPGVWKHKAEVKALSAMDWRRLAVLGLVFYTLTQGGQFVTLYYLEAVSFSLMLNFTTLLVAIFGIVFLKETLSRWQWRGIALFLIGVFVYFSPTVISGGNWIGYALAGFTVCANAAASILGRSVNRDAKISPLVVTDISMGIGALVLLGIGVAVEGIPQINLSAWMVIVWLAVVNTALAFLLWNKTLQILTAVESSIVNNTMLIQIAVLAWLFLGEKLVARDIVGLILAGIGVLIVNLKLGRRLPNRVKRGEN
ncbi:MAG: EamA family transporter [Chloroflexi bacterium]|nr:EamA family transporter [Chloroflexota bacterium]